MRRTLEQSWERYHSDDARWAPLRERFDWMAARCVGPNILDVGCGGALLASLLASRKDIEYVAAVDNYDGALRVAHRHIGVLRAALREKIVIFCLDADDLLFPDGHFDTVVAGEVLEHVKDPGAVLTELGRVLRPGGRLVVTVPNGGKITDEHLRTFNEKRLDCLLAGAGKVVEACEIGHWFCRCVNGSEEPVVGSMI